MLSSSLLVPLPPPRTHPHLQLKLPTTSLKPSLLPNFKLCSTSGIYRVCLSKWSTSIACSNLTSPELLLPHQQLPDGSEDFDVELGRLLSLLPEEMRSKISQHVEYQHLIEVVMDLGRKPLARFPTGDFVLSDYPVCIQDIQHATSLVGDFAMDNRAGISRTLHRISAIRNRKGEIIGLTCRVGRAISGSASQLTDLVKDGASLLLIGPPGVGKTTIIRDIARMLANDYDKRVMIVDTSNEIGGDGDIPHAGIGNARRMQVPNPDVQHKVLIEAVENHMPQVIVIDEIGTKLEAAAASTIAQRGIQLVATAHGITIENLVMNPSLEMLVGGIHSVTLGDEEASRRGVQKTVRERKGPSTFTCGVELISKGELRVHRSLEATVDAILSGRFPNYEVRKIGQAMNDEIPKGPFSHDFTDTRGGIVSVDNLQMGDEIPNYNQYIIKTHEGLEENSPEDGPTIQLFLYGIAEASVIQGFRQLRMQHTVKFTDNISEADALLALQAKLKKNARLQAAAKSCATPVYVAKASSMTQLTKAILALMTDYEDGFENFAPEINVLEKIDALEEARIAIEQHVIPKGDPVELLPRPSNILLLQKDLIRKYNLQCERVGVEPDVRLRILPFQDKDTDISGSENSDDEADELFSLSGESNGTPYSVDRLPLLPD
ncbi:Protein SEEDLING PLASTID DEVELOPMENT [Heracleum sosnowskyi]|uniref:Protein SEEDLING PLASTID DEVELOPMENT n=1 Tax=Heracleum sosnowskyi TaxID=360622 RepID=A0AAD8J1E9_9APIA|nr:Protein SEEDLING PLASTID DEVELOPMENT [Heracleum sosnowskyi]